MTPSSREVPGAPSLTVVVCTHSPERRGQVLHAVSSIRNQCGAADDIVVVVDHADHLLQWIRCTVPADVTVIANTGEQGLSGARNTGVARASGEVMVFIDDDAALRDGSLAAVRRVFAGRDVVAVGGAVNPVFAGGRAPRWFPHEFGWVIGCDYTGLARSGRPIRNPIGAAMAVRTRELRAVGGFSSDLGRVGSVPVGCEETLMAIELRRQYPSTTIVRDTEFAVDHHVPYSRLTLQYFVSRCYHEGRSKRILVTKVGANAGLSAERAYVARVLGRAAVAALGDLRRGRWDAGARAVAIALGFISTAVGFARGRSAPRPDNCEFARSTAA